MPPDVTQSFRLQRSDLKSSRAEDMLRLFIVLYCLLFTAKTRCDAIKNKRHL